jgi:antitoxin component YwqK of YwqJK toxin-antitoxin module
MDIAYALYKEYIENTDYVYYREHDTIIIMKKLCDLECLSNISPKKYHSVNLKVIVTFNPTDPYKLICLTKYKIDETVSSYCYLSLEDAFNLRQTYHITGEKQTECVYIDDKKNGLYQSWYENGQINGECTYINNEINGVYKQWYITGQIEKEFNCINSEKNGVYQSWSEDGQYSVKFNYVDNVINGLYEWYRNGKMYAKCNYINDRVHGLYQEWTETGELIEECMYIIGIKMN